MCSMCLQLIPFLTEKYCVVWLYQIFIYLFISYNHLGYFQFGAIMGNAALNIHIWAWTHFHFSWVCTYEWSRINSLIVSFENTCDLLGLPPSGLVHLWMFLHYCQDNLYEFQMLDHVNLTFIAFQWLFCCFGNKLWTIQTKISALCKAHSTRWIFKLYPNFAWTFYSFVIDCLHSNIYPCPFFYLQFANTCMFSNSTETLSSMRSLLRHGSLPLSLMAFRFRYIFSTDS